MSIQSLVFNILGDSSGAEKTFKGLEGKAAGAAAGVAAAFAGADIAGAIANSLDITEGRARLNAQLGLTGEDAARAGAIAGEAFGGNFGDSAQSVNTAVVGVQRNIGAMADLGEAQFTRLTEGALTVASVFDQDIGQTTAAVGQLMKTGLAKDGQDALNLLTRGFQTGSDKAGDLLDTVTEYSVQFRQLGLDGSTAMGLLNQGLKEGARDADTVADALKEFAIRGQEAVVSTAEEQAAAAEKAKAAGEALVAAQRTEAQAQQTVNDARQDAAENLENMADRLRSAEQALQSASTAVVRARQALAQAKTAEQEITAAQKDSRRAQEDLTTAREDAARKLKTLSSDLANAQLSERDAVLAVKRAKEEMFEASYDASSDKDPAELQLAYDKAVQALADQRTRVQDLKSEKASADKAGVSGSRQVLAAQEAVNKAKENERNVTATAGNARSDAEQGLKQALRSLDEQRRAVAELRTEKAAADQAGIDGNARVIAAQEAARDAQQATAKAVTEEAKARAGTGPQLTAIGQAYQTLGLDAVASQQAIARGGEPARQVLARVLDGLRGVEDPAQRSALAVTLFGTKAEDLQQSLYALDPGTAAAALGTTAGAAQGLATALDTPASQVESMRRRLDLMKASLIDTDGPLGSITAGVSAFAPEIGAASTSAMALGLMLKGPVIGGASVAMTWLGNVGRTAGLAALAFGRGAAAAGLWAGRMLIAGAVASGTAAKTLALRGAQVVATVAQWAWNAAATANPLGLIIVGIAALVAGLIWAYNNVEWFRDGVNAVFKGIGDVIGGMWNGIISGFKLMVRGAAILWNMTLGGMRFDIPTWVPLIGGQSWQLPKLTVPALAAGGVVTSPTLALIGEAGTEAVVPLDRAGDYGFGSGGGVTVVLQIGSGVIMGSPSDVARQLKDLIIQEIRRGTIPAPAGWGK